MPASLPVIAAAVAPAAAPRARPPTGGAGCAPGPPPLCCEAQFRQAAWSWLIRSGDCPLAG
ncbi:hypothetical protein F1189_05140 [Rhodovastum atsumiense]|uniref:Uncharacterized protein n=1 Tax=Rhodovastum atsumiense TaxID=504468 RepID=A0A5M6IYM3_9PROT|nr:hypothetical protein F1189_05140 [Rhodovastum atsumiense]